MNSKNPKTKIKINKILQIIYSIKKDSNLFKLKFSQKIEVYKLVSQCEKFKDLSDIESSDIDKIRTFRNQAVHSEFILDKFTTDNPSINALHNIIDKEYEEEFLEGIQGVLNKYELGKYFSVTNL